MRRMRHENLIVWHGGRLGGRDVGAGARHETSTDAITLSGRHWRGTNAIGKLGCRDAQHGQLGAAGGALLYARHEPVPPPPAEGVDRQRLERSARACLPQGLTGPRPPPRTLSKCFLYF